eukprot:GHVR01115789.1.p1 GENE.GHVR01115789.1~~GHVR01115789.1.p1  ORF type:complete len:310 (+),score=22.19 GHVR01115789.1:30-932(+)
MIPKILIYGSINIDYVYRVPHIVKSGETLSSQSLDKFVGGKGANQSVSLCRAGAHNVFHGGKIGKDEIWLKSKLEENGVNTEFIQESSLNTGHAIIQVAFNGENSIFLFPGANRDINQDDISNTLCHFSAGDFLILQNEINFIPELLREGASKGLYICFNAAPMSQEVFSYPLDLCSLLILNETESETLIGKTNSVEKILNILSDKFPKTSILLTVGEKGAYYRDSNSIEKIYYQPAEIVDCIDSTAAGDTFIGYFLSSIFNGDSVEKALKTASIAASLCVCKAGAMCSIPFYADVNSLI